MAVNHRFSVLLLAVTLGLMILTGCGSSRSLSFPPPQGSFTNANLNGPYAFSYTGADGGGFLAVAGSFQADGAGHITSGMQDINSGFAVSTNAPITGTYTVRADGRGSANLNSPAGNTVIDFVLVAGGHGLITRFDANAAASGTLDQQTPSAFSNAALAGQFAFTVSGIDAANNPLAVGGNFTSNAAGNITSGIDDSNDNGGVATDDPLTGMIPVSANGRGSATLNTIRGVLTFAFYVVDANHLKLVELDGAPVLGGEAFRQTGPFSNASVSGPFAFTVAVPDLADQNPFAAGGVVTSDGAGTITSGTEDFNNSGVVTSNVPVTGTYSMASNGRGTLTMTTSLGTTNFVIYPSSAGVLLLETDVLGVTSGVALQQQTSAFANSTFHGAYGFSLGGSSVNGALHTIAQVTADGISQLTGITDVNSSGSVTFGQPLNGTYSVSPNGRTTLTLQSVAGTQNIAVYLVNPNRAVFLDLNSTLVAVGDIRRQ